MLKFLFKEHPFLRFLFGIFSLIIFIGARDCTFTYTENFSSDQFLDLNNSDFEVWQGENTLSPTTKPYNLLNYTNFVGYDPQGTNPSKENFIYFGGITQDGIHFIKYDPTFSSFSDGRTINDVFIPIALNPTTEDLFIGGTNNIGFYNFDTNVYTDLRQSFLTAFQVNPLTEFCLVKSGAYDPDDNFVFIGTSDGKFGYYNLNLKQFVRISGDQTISKRDWIHGIAYDPKNKKVYLAGREFNGAEYDIRSNTLKPITYFDNLINSDTNYTSLLLYDQSHNQLYDLTYNSALLKYDFSTGTSTEVISPTTNHISGNIIFNPNDKKIYMFSGLGRFYSYDPTTNQTSLIYDFKEPIQGYYSKRFNTFYIIGFNIYVYTPGSSAPIMVNPSDYESLLWPNAQAKNIYQAIFNRDNGYPIWGNFRFNSAVLSPSGKIFIGSAYGEVLTYTPGTNELQRLTQQLPDSIQNSLSVDVLYVPFDNSIYIMGTQGLVRYDLNTKTVTDLTSQITNNGTISGLDYPQYIPSVNAIYFVDTNTQMLYKFDLNTQTVIYTGLRLPESSMATIAYDNNNGKVYIGGGSTVVGLPSANPFFYEFDPLSSTINNLTAKVNSLTNNNAITSVIFDPDNNRLYIGGTTFLGYYEPESGIVSGNFLTQSGWVQGMTYNSVDKNVYVTGYGFLGKLATTTNQYQSYQYRKYSYIAIPSRLIFDPISNALIVMLDADLFYLKPSSTSIVLSKTINNLALPINSATLTANDEPFSGTVKYYLSNNGG